MKIYYLLVLLFSFFSVAQNSGDVLIQGKLLKSKSGKLYLYEFLGNDSFIIDSAIVRSNNFAFKKQKFVKGFYKLAFQNETNNIEFVINPKETSVLNMSFNEYRLSSNYAIENSRDNKAKKIFNKKKNEIERNINKAKRDASKTVEMRKKEVQKLNKEMETFSTNLASTTDKSRESSLSTESPLASNPCASAGCSNASGMTSAIEPNPFIE